MEPHPDEGMISYEMPGDNSASAEAPQSFPTMTDPLGPNRASPDNAGRVLLIERSFLVLLTIGLLVGVAAIIKPFTNAILFGASLATAAWPVRQALVRCGLSRGTAATILLLCSLALIGLPIIVVAPNLVGQVGEGMQRLQDYFSGSPAQPAWLAGIPLIGQRLALAWHRLVETEGNLRDLSAPHASALQQMVVTAARGLADSVIQMILSLVVATMFWANGEPVVAVLHDALRRVGGIIAEQTLDIAALAIRGVAYGVVGTAVIQAVLLGIGLGIAGVPGAMMLGFVGLLLAISQIGGPLLILIWGGAAWWLFSNDQQIWGAFMIGWGLLVSTIDNLIKPWLIGFGMNMPLSLTILGVFGGFIAFGFLGLFIGPTLICILFNLLQAWRGAAANIGQRT